MMTRTMVKKAIRTVLAVEGAILPSYLYSFEMFINIQIAFLSSLFVIIGASFAYAKMVDTKLTSGEYEEQRDILDEIEDEHGLYDDIPINDTPAEELDLKTIVKEEKAKIKTFSLSSIKHGARGSASLFRVVPYVFLILGFIALKNNDLLSLSVYLPSLLIGIIVGSVVSKSLVANP